MPSSRELLLMIGMEDIPEFKEKMLASIASSNSDEKHKKNLKKSFLRSLTLVKKRYAESNP